jgi:hypothetical protein
MDRPINAIPADLNALLAMNPLAAEQLRNIVLERRVKELEAELAKNGSKEPVKKEA